MFCVHQEGGDIHGFGWWQGDVCGIDRIFAVRVHGSPSVSVVPRDAVFIVLLNGAQARVNMDPRAGGMVPAIWVITE